MARERIGGGGGGGGEDFGCPSTETLRARPGSTAGCANDNVDHRQPATQKPEEKNSCVEKLGSKVRLVGRAPAFA